MKIHNDKDLIKGWFVGNFEPTMYKTKDFEVAYKKYSENESEEPHYHKVATEITYVTKGTISMNGTNYDVGSIIVIEPNDIVHFKSITDSETIVVKIPSVIGDKYIVNENEIYLKDGL